MKFIKKQGDNQDWYWRLIADNGESIAIGGEGYRNEADCDYAIDLVRGHAASTEVYRDGVFGIVQDRDYPRRSARKPGLFGGLRP
ncbi:MAG: hypothetical protein DI552_00070 [Brevundimonas sp.]|jgi:uncharacterized protein YegP (UPF0339 family)|uniref:YegP family protein n=1 Tax=Brevundimonas sp. TaxID=1871086 RepID=UPI000DBC04CA|nr:YegP family protein [Brevundimonas sp.]PZU62302.1 MAG: hypothetical protein DI552_00070 [Brevundimonas sp.]